MNGCITVTDSLGLIQNQDIANTYSGIVTFATVTYDGITDIQVVINDNLCAPIPTPSETPSASPTTTPTPTTTTSCNCEYYSFSISFTNTSS